MSHRAPTRPRYGRIATLATSVTVTMVAALAGLGVLSPSPAMVVDAGARTASYDTRSTSTDADQPVDQPVDSGSAPEGNASASADAVTPPGMHTAHVQDQTVLPARSGVGRRVVFSQRLQRVWLVAHPKTTDVVRKTYLVSGSVTHNLQPGTYAVYSRSRWAVGVDDSGVMQYFVRFTRGPTGAAIGFHSIPTKNGVPLQTRAQLGTPESHGCIRQYLPDAIALWNFAPVGTKVVVVA